LSQNTASGGFWPPQTEYTIGPRSTYVALAA
jgi:hypothetical protein